MPTLLWIASVYAAMSVVTFAAYGVDKHRAQRGKRRIRERTLHVLELLGGWPGALAGQMIFRHKRRKLAYMVVFVAIVACHGAVWFGIWRLGWFG